MIRQSSMELILQDEVCKLLDNFATLMKIQVAFFSAEGKVLLRSRDYVNSHFCNIMQRDFFSLDECCHLDQKMQLESLKQRKTICYQCHAKLNEVVAPCFLYDNLIGYIMFGQFRIEGDTPNFFGSSELEHEYYKLPLFTEKEVENLISMLNVMINYIITNELIAPNNDLISKVNQYINKFYKNKITLKMLAKHLCCSESTLTHYLQKNYHTSFKKILTQKRMEVAQEILSSNPELTLMEIAPLIGYDDYQYFSRVYKKYYNYSPKHRLS